jgi:hypothetical protein
VRGRKSMDGIRAVPEISQGFHEPSFNHTVYMLPVTGGTTECETEEISSMDRGSDRASNTHPLL